MNVDRFRNGMAGGDLDAVVATLAPDIRLFSPTTHLPFRGIDQVRPVLGAVLTVLEDLSYVGELAGAADSGGAVHGLLFRGRVADREFHGLDLLELDGTGSIATLTIMVRPLSGLTALKDAMTSALATGRVR
ncbi:nuclear transport factor 2 family protein [Nocardia sp. NBC_00565]|uniref:nuclear transport factor 2 family protein n=1 Tax=Nocardia sp. NBC_00565 TaxID=2975993 RepID=UPI002E8078D0|nr:nuclear transport factor 2 family protein [Nocardia sp. NBC_00565]WUC00150.1 nuclear transport factor 2 family protein [Nocardia sp. NBC_00565]